jgi:hypothetical protein
VSQSAATKRKAGDEIDLPRSSKKSALSCALCSRPTDRKESLLDYRTGKWFAACHECCLFAADRIDKDSRAWRTLNPRACCSACRVKSSTGIYLEVKNNGVTLALCAGCTPCEKSPQDVLAFKDFFGVLPLSAEAPTRLDKGGNCNGCSRRDTPCLCIGAADKFCLVCLSGGYPALRSTLGQLSAVCGACNRGCKAAIQFKIKDMTFWVCTECMKDLDAVAKEKRAAAAAAQERKVEFNYLLHRLLKRQLQDFLEKEKAAACVEVVEKKAAAAVEHTSECDLCFKDHPEKDSMVMTLEGSGVKRCVCPACRGEIKKYKESSSAGNCRPLTSGTCVGGCNRAILARAVATTDGGTCHFCWLCRKPGVAMDNAETKIECGSCGDKPMTYFSFADGNVALCRKCIPREYLLHAEAVSRTELQAELKKLARKRDTCVKCTVTTGACENVLDAKDGQQRPMCSGCRAVCKDELELGAYCSACSGAKLWTDGRFAGYKQHCEKHKPADMSLKTNTKRRCPACGWFSGSMVLLDGKDVMCALCAGHVHWEMTKLSAPFR